MSAYAKCWGVILGVALCVGSAWAQEALDLTMAVIVAPGDLSPREQKARDLLIDEVMKRTQVRLSVVDMWPKEDVLTIALMPKRSVESFGGARVDVRGWDAKPEGYLLRTLPGKNTVEVIGADERGVLFGVGRLLRELRMEPKRVTLLGALDIASAPAQALRGHQLGYRPKTNSYDAWDVPVWEQYIRDLAVFGTNAIEIMPPRTDDDADSPHFPLPQIEMMAHQSRIADDLGLDVWIWYPAMDKDYSDPATVEAALKEWGEVFAKLPRIDAVFVPGGDPGHTQPRHMFALLEKQTEVLHRTHPNAQMWMSPQSFTDEWEEEFFELMKAEPKWLSGIVFGPQNRCTLEELRARVPKQYPIRHYPDITHTVRCQFPVPEWDLAYALTEHREPINPRPTDYANVIRRFSEGTIGFITYSEGCNDDVNKIVWSSLGWDPDKPVVDVLREYSRYFIGPKFEEGFAQGLLALERNWRGPLLTNKGVFTTLAQFQAMEKAASPDDLLNWRFQQALYRAYYDAYDARRLSYETELEGRAMDYLRRADTIGAKTAIKLAQEMLKPDDNNPVASDLRARVFELADALYKSIRMQLSVPLYKAIDAGRGANLDYIDVPLNNREWLVARLDEILKTPSDEGQLRALAEITNWTNPGPGGFYDDLGNNALPSHVVEWPIGDADFKGPAWKQDPEFRTTPLSGLNFNKPGWRMSWYTCAESRFDMPLVMKYEGLDPKRQYHVKVTYAGDRDANVRLVAGKELEVHGYIKKPLPTEPFAADLPLEATADGTLTLTFTQEPGGGGSGRGCQVAEVWVTPVN